jgi:hypothetical protein
MHAIRFTLQVATQYRLQSSRFVRRIWQTANRTPNTPKYFIFPLCKIGTRLEIIIAGTFPVIFFPGTERGDKTRSSLSSKYLHNISSNVI